MPHISVTTTIDRPPAAVYAYVEEHSNTARYVDGITSWEPATEQVHGVGSTFRASMQLGPKQLESTLRITEAEPGVVLAWAPVDGFSQSGAWHFAADGEGTQARFDVDVTFPGGLAGRLLGKTIEPAIRSSVAKTVANLKEQVEALPR